MGCWTLCVWTEIAEPQQHPNDKMDRVLNHTEGQSTVCFFPSAGSLLVLTES